MITEGIALLSEGTENVQPKIIPGMFKEINPPENHKELSNSRSRNR